MTDLINQARSKTVKGPGLKPAGIVVLQLFLIFLFESIEYALGKVGIITGIVIILLTLAGLVLGRSGTALTNAAMEEPYINNNVQSSNMLFFDLWSFNLWLEEQEEVETH